MGHHVCSFSKLLCEVYTLFAAALCCYLMTVLQALVVNVFLEPNPTSSIVPISVPMGEYISLLPCFHSILSFSFQNLSSICQKHFVFKPVVYKHNKNNFYSLNQAVSVNLSGFRSRTDRALQSFTKDSLPHLIVSHCYFVLSAVSRQSCAHLQQLQDLRELVFLRPASSARLCSAVLVTKERHQYFSFTPARLQGCHGIMSRRITLKSFVWYSWS